MAADTHTAPLNSLQPRHIMHESDLDTDIDAIHAMMLANSALVGIIKDRINSPVHTDVEVQAVFEMSEQILARMKMLTSSYTSHFQTN